MGKAIYGMGKYGAINHFYEIEAWKLARRVRIASYKIIKILPDVEKYCLASQIRRTAISVTANIAAGFGRFHFQENIQFCRQSRGSLYETLDHLLTCYGENYILKEEFDEINKLIVHCAKALNGYIRWLKKQKEDSGK